jgi:NADPH:quinone reductase-like Zn-dependent oxidoreductase
MPQNGGLNVLRGPYFDQPSFPFVPGYDVVGTITEVGRNVHSLAALTETGGWAEHVDRRFPLAEASEALESGGATGKVVLVPEATGGADSLDK